jgi:hypothetical protein
LLSNSAEPDAGELRIPVIEQIWHVFLPVIGPGQLSCRYGHFARALKNSQLTCGET